MTTHLVIPDCQVTPDTPQSHLGWIGEYIVEAKPDVINCLGDFADMESLSHYDRGKLKYEGRRYARDIRASVLGMTRLTTPMSQYNKQRKQTKKRSYKPQMNLFLGNHEYRIVRAIEDDPKMEGFMSTDDLRYAEFGWTVHDFLKIVAIDGVHYSHYFYNPLSGRPYGGQSVETRLKNLGFSFIMGHQQLYMSGSRPLNNGQRLRGLVHGSCYLHDEDYRGPQGNNEMRAIFMLHDVQGGDYRVEEIPLDYLCRKNEGMPLARFMKQKFPDLYAHSLWLQYQDSLEPKH